MTIKLNINCIVIVCFHILKIFDIYIIYVYVLYPVAAVGILEGLDGWSVSGRCSAC